MIFSYTWDTPVRDILGDDFYFHDGLLTNQTTLRDVAAHTHGIDTNNFFLWTKDDRPTIVQ